MGYTDVIWGMLGVHLVNILDTLIFNNKLMFKWKSFLYHNKLKFGSVGQLKLIGVNWGISKFGWLALEIIGYSFGIITVIKTL